MPIEYQSEANECGLACLAMVLAAFEPGWHLGKLRRSYPRLSRGATLSDLQGAAQSLGFAARGLRAEPTHLRELRLPAILHWDANHFVVLVRIGVRHCVVHDPAAGRVHVPWSELGERFTGVVLELWPEGPARGAIQGACAARPRLALRDLWSTVRIGRRDVAWVLLLSGLAQLLFLLGPLQLQWTVDEAVVVGDTHLLLVLAIGFGLVALLRGAVDYLRGLLVVHLAAACSFQLTSKLLRQLVSLPVTWFEARRVGDVASRFASLGPVRDFVSQGAAGLVVDLLVVLLSGVLMLVYAPWLAGLVLVWHSTYLLVYAMVTPSLQRLGLAGVVAEAAEESHVLETIRAIHSVKVYNQEGPRHERWQSLHATTLDRGVRLQRRQLGVQVFASLAAGAELIVTLYLLAHEALAGVLSLGMLFAFITYRGHFAAGMASAVERLLALRLLRVHLARLDDIWGEAEAGGVEARLSRRHGDTARPAGARGGVAVRLERVTISYAGAPPLVDGLTLAVSAGEFVAIVGPSGAGKTTLLKAVLGLLPVDGSVRIDGRAPGDGRVAIGCVLQEDGFFAGSIADNVCLFQPPDPDRLRACLAGVGMLDMVCALPMSMETQVGDIGLGLSSGQMQRLMLARALYRQPELLVLDEGTANLDGESARVVHQLVAGMANTRIVVTHDLDFARAADRVFVLESGRLTRWQDPPVRTSRALSAS